VIRPTLTRERALWAAGCRLVAGVDEVGRGPLAGPVVAAAVILRPEARPIRGLRDSKLLSERQRERAAQEVRRQALAWAIAAASAREIDRINIRRATALAMRRALARLSFLPERVLVDGTPLPELGCAHEAMVDGDACCQSIAAASVLAKQARDRLMLLLARRYPAFGWEENKGYATEVHLAALDRAGPTRHHRVTFMPVAQLKLSL
jgi:ribonuclease HII